MEKAWYIINYHDVNWEEPMALKVGGTVPPNFFADHLQYLCQKGELVSIEEGERRVIEGNLNKPLFSIWFDDGLKGVLKYAAPILKKYNLKAAISINSDFYNHNQLGWIFKLSYLRSTDYFKSFRSFLRKKGWSSNDTMLSFVVDNFSIEIVKYIDTLYAKIPEHVRSFHLQHLFCSVSELKELQDRGWLIANHSKSHFPVIEETAFHLIKEEFMKCEIDMLANGLNSGIDYLVIPFDRVGERVADYENLIRRMFPEKKLILVGQTGNSAENILRNVYYRISAPWGWSSDFDLILH